MTWTDFWTSVQDLHQHSEMMRIVATVASIGVGVLLNRTFESRLQRKASHADGQADVLDTARKQFVQLKNIVWVTVALIVITIWASKIAGIVLSLAAVAGATLIVSKELLMCLLGYGYLTGTRAYRVGDYIEVNGMRGKVVDIDIFATTLAENSVANQLTGKTLTMPNSVVLGHSIRNISATGEHIINMVQYYLPLDADVALAEKLALEAAEGVNGQWQSAINRHLAKLEMRNLVDVPSARPKVLWIPADSKQHSLVIRYGCPVAQRVTSEQEIFRRFWSSYNSAMVRNAELKKDLSIRHIQVPGGTSSL